MTRSELVRQARQGDRDAFDILLTDVVDHLYRIARLVLRDFDRAEDAVQEALVRCWRELPSLREPDRFDAWTAVDPIVGPPLAWSGRARQRLER